METGQAMSTPSMNANYTLKRERAQRNPLRAAAGEEV
jgi:hypothetical protein